MPIIETTQNSGFISRVLELTSTHAPWHRRLWRTGTIRFGTELLEEVVNPSLPESALSDMKKHFKHAVQSDPGVADRGKSMFSVLSKLGKGAAEQSHSWLGVNAHVERISADYLKTWAKVFDSNSTQIDAEGAARRITAHLVDSGYHKMSLHSWIKALEKNNEKTTVSDFLLEADRRLSSPEGTYTFCVPVETKPPFEVGNGANPGWMNSTETATWKRRNAPDARSIRQEGSFCISVKARDFNSAVDRARARVFDLQNKFDLGTRRDLRICSEMWSKEKGATYPVKSTDRKIEVKSLELQGKIQSLESAESMANALALVHQLRTSPPHLALMSGWSAIESLLIGTADERDSVAAERFATIVAASLIRAELTGLAWEYAKDIDDDVSRSIKDAPDNLARAKIFQVRAMSESCTPIMFSSPLNGLALERIRPALTDPEGEIKKTSTILQREFIRLYRKRNLIAHAGKTQDMTLHSTSELVSPLIGAGIDRIVYCDLKYGLTPIELSARLEAKIPHLQPATDNDPGNSIDLFEF